MANEGEAAEIDWEARNFKFLEPNQITGRWRSRSKLGTASGAFILTKSERGDKVWGWWIGPEEDGGGQRYSQWVMVRDETALSEDDRQDRILSTSDLLEQSVVKPKPPRRRPPRGKSGTP